MLTDANKHLTFGKKQRTLLLKNFFFNKAENTKTDQVTRTK